MKSKIIEESLPNKDKFPFIGKINTGDKLVVLFTSNKTGIVLVTDDFNTNIGEKRSDWLMERFDIVSKMTIEFNL